MRHTILEDLQQEIIDELKNVYDPEIRVNIVDLGLIYSVALENGGFAKIIMTLTAPACPVSDQIVADVQNAAKRHPDVDDVDVELVWDPPWNRDMMSEEAKLMLGFF